MTDGGRDLDPGRGEETPHDRHQRERVGVEGDPVPDRAYGDDPDDRPPHVASAKDESESESEDEPTPDERRTCNAIRDYLDSLEAGTEIIAVASATPRSKPDHDPHGEANPHLGPFTCPICEAEFPIPYHHYERQEFVSRPVELICGECKRVADEYLIDVVPGKWENQPE